jgi:hypothetical protein
LTDKIKALDQAVEQASLGYISKRDEPAFLDPYTPMVYRLAKSFDVEELTQLAYDIGINMEIVGGEGLLDKCRRLVEYAARRNKLLDLMAMAGSEEHRPPVEQWSELL